MASSYSFESPQRTVQLLLAANVAIYGLCMMQSGQADIPAGLLFRYGAMYSDALDRGEYWRLVTAGFLHANPVHIFGNMLCLVLWGGPLEKRLGAFYFFCIYLSGLIAGGLVSIITHAGPYIGVGASGAISAVLGALLSLRLLGLISLPWNFFVINIGLNIALAVGISRIDWGAHLGGFVAGMVACSCLDLLERVLPWLLRCRFPEFVKMNGFIVFVTVAAYSRIMAGAASSRQNILMAALVVVGLAGIKVIDLVLSTKKGLAVIAVAFVLANPALVLLWRGDIAPAMASLCAAQSGTANMAASTICANIDGSIAIAALAALAFTLLLYWPQLTRGLSDVGFIGASLRGERARRHRL
jgi:membrane associated rhomboid family serine protease